ncbi:hypothetical protein UFOVP1296_47 [uncultured Caudovirales phage]|jgi:hypothetical protein|uniref:Uncharacterized protein n=1 Tax=uncultured Caudovirales phage TaxID=2100421 RepID=A0A6J5PHX8_9CAUD|nr:hypothetical protein UFOVP471_47 [uncultured Caudovirales phage]CAB4169516.1 hypothetical protein UFOVP890_47 [uncultured Caudovirales phage]CAB4195961.1 hypothetical protein UFOVP1296_47 [uncultured Caudovirales phage]
MAKQPSKDLAARLSQPVPSPYANRCSIGHVLKKVSPEEREALDIALGHVSNALSTSSTMSSGYTTRWLADVLEEFGHKVSDRMIRRHAKGECSCDA